ncbi:MAG TPA: NAD-dependent epimerase/dehydratase family protein [Acidobacteriaceae bacterium]|nr:NAD-dependent epimerase/dehydratase family protein [Acidobacteriaceae bacterium]
MILFGATGMVGQGVLRECVLDREVTAVVSVVRKATAPGLGRRSEKVREVVAADLADLSRVEGELMGYDACLFCVGVSAVEMKEAEYRRVTFEMTTSAARTLLRVNPTSVYGDGMTFLYVSGAGTNSNGRAMWARVKGETEDWLLSMGFKAAYMFRPGMIVPRDGIVSKTGWYRGMYAAMRPVLPMLLRMFPKHVTTTDQMGRAMLAVAKHGYAKQVLEAGDIAGV